MQKKWLDTVEGFANAKGYEICSDGTLISHRRGTPRVIHGYPDQKGYLRADIVGAGRAKKKHRLVALAFIPNPENKPQVNHIDADKQNNQVENLEWCTNGENQLHLISLGLKNLMEGEKNYQFDKEHENCKKVIQMDIEGNFIAEYTSLASASRAVGLKSYTAISKVCRGKAKSAGGYKWKLKV